MIVDLPQEALLKIFHQLDYIVLKKLTRVSKAFRALISHASLDKQLFRDGISRDNARFSAKDIHLHPSLDFRMMYKAGQSIEDIYLYLASRKVDLSPSIDFNRNYAQEAAKHKRHTGRTLHDEPFLINTEVAHEFATSPAVQTLVIRNGDMWFEAKCESGVTVLHVMEAMCDFFVTPSVPRWHRYQKYYITPSESLGENHKFFDGFDGHEIGRTGRLILRLANFSA